MNIITSLTITIDDDSPSSSAIKWQKLQTQELIIKTGIEHDKIFRRSGADSRKDH